MPTSSSMSINVSHRLPKPSRWLDRRAFLGDLSEGLGGIALAALFAEQGFLKAGPEVQIDVAARKSHFTARAKRVLHVFCTGAVSHLDTFDYKPALWKRHGQPMPGIDKLITFQGENGNVARSPWAFKPRGRVGKMTSDLLPHLGQCVDDICFIHSLTSKT